MTIAFQLEGQEFIALNGGPTFKFTEAISFVVNCETQEEVDELREKLSEGGEKVACGWLKDKFGLSWQIVPTVLSEMMQDKDPEKSQRVMKAVLKMKKLDIAALEAAYRQGQGQATKSIACPTRGYAVLLASDLSLPEIAACAAARRAIGTR